jgi:S1-C subfamily serine protease
MKKLLIIPAILMLSSCNMIRVNSEYVNSASDALESTVLVSTADGSGSGFHIGNGLFISNAHVVLDRHGKAPLSPVYLIDGAAAELMAYDPIRDLAILRCGLKAHLKPFKVSLEPVKLKDDVLSVGTSFGVIEVASKGFVSGIIDGAIITTAPSNHGCSGGSLLNTSYEVIGVNAFGYSPDYSWSGISGHIDAKTLVEFLQDVAMSKDAG